MVAVGEIVAASDGVDVIGVDARSGEELWRTRAPPGEMSLLATTSIWLDDGSDAAGLVALNPLDGSIDLSPTDFPTSAGPQTSKTLEDLTFRGEYGRPTRTGDWLWQTPIASWAAQAWDLDLPLLYLASGTTVSALDPATGAEVWAVDASSPGQGGRYTEPGSYTVVTADNVVVAFIEAREPDTD